MGTQEIVKNILQQVNDREEKIKEKISALDKEAADTKNEIDRLMMELVDAELRDDTNVQDELNQKLLSLRDEYNLIQDKLKSYSEALKDDRFIKKEIPKAIDVARMDLQERKKLIQKNEQSIKELKKKLEDLQKQIEHQEFVQSNLVGRTEAKQLVPLLKYIEPRKIKYGCEEHYMNGVMGGVEGELLEQYIEPEE